MRISDLTVKTPVGEYKGLRFDFSKRGVYVLRGTYLTGASKAARAIALNALPTFDSQELTDSFGADRNSVITYVPPIIASTRETVFDYIKKGDPSITSDDVVAVLKRFNVGEPLSTPCVALNDELKSALPICAAFVRETPYIIIDVPHGAGDATLSLLNEALNETTATVILVTNENRFFDKAVAFYDFTENDVVCRVNKSSDDESESVETAAPPPKTAATRASRVSAYRSLLKVTQSPRHYVVFALFLLFTIGSSLYSYFSFNNIGNTTALRDNQIHVIYSNDIGDRNIGYAEERDLDINSAARFSVNNVRHVANNFDCDIYVKEYNHFENIDYSSGVFVFSAPEGFGVFRYLLSDMNYYFDSGRYDAIPKDWEREAALSTKAAEHFALGDNPVGKTITYDGQTYTVVSMIDTPNPAMRLSYNGSGLGVYQYQRDTFDAFVEETGINSPEVLFVTKTAQQELDILDYIVAYAPNSRILSNTYIDIADYRSNLALSNYFAARRSIFVGAIMILLLIIVCRRYIERGIRIANSYVYRYTNTVRGKTAFILITLAPFILSAVIMMIGFPSPVRYYLLIPTLLSCVTIGIMSAVYNVKLRD